MAHFLGLQAELWRGKAQTKVLAGESVPRVRALWNSPVTFTRNALSSPTFRQFVFQSLTKREPEQFTLRSQPPSSIPLPQLLLLGFGWCSFEIHPSS